MAAAMADRDMFGGPLPLGGTALGTVGLMSGCMDDCTGLIVTVEAEDCFIVLARASAADGAALAEVTGDMLRLAAAVEGSTVRPDGREVGTGSLGGELMSGSKEAKSGESRGDCVTMDRAVAVVVVIVEAVNLVG